MHATACLCVFVSEGNSKGIRGDFPALEMVDLLVTSRGTGWTDSSLKIVKMCASNSPQPDCPSVLIGLRCGLRPPDQIAVLCLG